MSGVDHLPSEEYRRSARSSPDCRLSLHAHQHLVSTCPECGQDWQELGPKLQGMVQQELAATPPLTASPEPHPDDLSGHDEAIDALAAQAALLRKRRRRAKKQLSELRCVPAARRQEKVRGAYRRFRSRLLAELLIEEAQKVVRNAPAEAESFASLVPLVLDWAQGEEHSTWAPTLVTRALAHEANALRVAGQLNRSESLLSQIELTALPHPGVRAEILSLEGSLRTDQWKFDSAERALRRAIRGYSYVGDKVGLVKVRIQMANLKQAQSNTEEALRLFELADHELASVSRPDLAVATVTGRVNALCDLGRPKEARTALQARLDTFEDFDSPFIAAHLRTLEGRISLGLQDYAEAEDFFLASASTLRMIGRHLDAASVSLFLAEALLAQGRSSDLRAISAQLSKEFQHLRIDAEALKALQLFSRAVATDKVTSTLLEAIRRKLSESA